MSVPRARMLNGRRHPAWGFVAYENATRATETGVEVFRCAMAVFCDLSTILTSYKVLVHSFAFLPVGFCFKLSLVPLFKTSWHFVGSVARGIKPRFLKQRERFRISVNKKSSHW